MKLKRYLSSFALSAAILIAGTAGAETLTVSSVTAAAGDTAVSVPILIDIPGNTAGASFTITNSCPNALTLTDVTSTFFDTFTNQGISPADVEVEGTTYDQPLVHTTGTGNVMVAGARISDGATENTMFTLEYTVDGSASAQNCTIGITASLITNAAAGYPDETAIPMLIGYDAAPPATYPEIIPTIVAGTFSITAGFPDTDNDGIDDDWERANFGTLGPADATTDFDQDGYSDLVEYQNGTNPFAMDAPGGTGYNPATDIRNANAVNDFDGDGKSDILWRNNVSGTLYQWLMNGTSISSTGIPGTVASQNWTIKGKGDFDGDGKSDIVWRNVVSGSVLIWLMDGTTVLSSTIPGTVSGLHWQIKAIGDFNGDGKADIMWRNQTSGTLYLWLMNGTAITSTGIPGTVASMSWVIKDAGDFDGDGKSDLIWRNTVSGSVLIWLMNGTSIVSSTIPGTVSGLHWQIKAIGDFNGDGKSDVMWRNQVSGTLYLWLMDGTTISSTGIPGTVSSLSWIVKDAGDFDGNGKSDLVWRNTVSGSVLVWMMDGTTVLSSTIPGTVSSLNWLIQ